MDGIYSLQDSGVVREGVSLGYVGRNQTLKDLKVERACCWALLGEIKT